ncbi:MAG: hypothetical protein WB626_05505 [Bacteroidota bacterium]
MFAPVFLLTASGRGGTLALGGEEPPPGAEPEWQVVEPLLEQMPPEGEDPDLGVRWEAISDRGLDPRRLSREDLESVPELTGGEIRAAGISPLVPDSIQATGAASAEQLERLRRKLAPYLRSAEASSGGAPSLLHFRMRGVRELRLRRGYRDGTYAGSPLKYFQRLVFRREPGLGGGLLAEKDAGERVRDGFLSGFLEAGNPAFRVIAGDFTAQAGRRLVFGGPARYSHPREEASRMVPGSAFLRPHMSSDEARFFRGIAAECPLRAMGAGLMLGGVLSWRRLDAAVHEDGSAGSLEESGLFRTWTERMRRGTVPARSWGARLSAHLEGGTSIGVSLLGASFGRNIGGDGSPGHAASVAGLDLAGRAGGLDFFGEMAFSAGGGKATVAGLSAQAGAGVETALLFRACGGSFSNPYAAFTPGGGPGERGLTVRVDWFPLRGLLLAGFLDLSRRDHGPAGFPAREREAGCEAEWRAGGGLLVQALVRAGERSAAGMTAGSGGLLGRRTDLERARRIRCTLGLRSGPVFLRSRVEGVRVEGPAPGVPEEGVLLLQELRWGTAGRVDVEIRLVLFQTGSYLTRLYAAERDLPGSYANPPLYGKGVRWHLLGRIRPGRFWDLSLKYVQTLKEGVEETGPGADGIPGGMDERFGVQLDLRL